MSYRGHGLELHLDERIDYRAVGAIPSAHYDAQVLLAPELFETAVAMSDTTTLCVVCVHV
jgi:hypothetical protein